MSHSDHDDHDHGDDRDRGDDHDPPHDHPHDHGPRDASDRAIRVKALESLLVEKGLLSTDVVDTVVRAYEQDIGPLNGARVVARAWTDPDYRSRLLADGTGAIAEMGFQGMQGECISVIENTPGIHNVVVCTLCSCYPWPVLGLPPTWYKSEAYRSRVVIEPRAVLRDFGLELAEEIEVRVWDSTAELRYMVLPERPVGSEGMDEAALTGLVGRDSMIGVARATAPDASGGGER
jgi:nitrile hydratase